jgi:hypothetical protein
LKPWDARKNFKFTRNKEPSKTAAEFEFKLDVSKKQTEKQEQRVHELEENFETMICKTFEASAAAIRASVSNILELEDIDPDHTLKDSLLNFLRSQIEAVEGNLDAISYAPAVGDYGYESEKPVDLESSASESSDEGSVDQHNRRCLDVLVDNPNGLNARIASDCTGGKGAKIQRLKEAAMKLGWKPKLEDERRKRKAREDGGRHSKGRRRCMKMRTRWVL